MSGSKFMKAPFYWFMKDFGDKERRATGKQYTLSELPAICAPLWDTLDENQRKPYKERAAAFKSSGRTVVSASSQSSTGRTPSTEASQATNLTNHALATQNLPQAAGDIDEDDVAQAIVDKIVRDNSVDELKNKSMVVVAFNVLVVTQNNRHIPNEVAMTRFSIEDGIQDSMHEFINFKEIPRGYLRAAIEHSQDYHKLPMDGFPGKSITDEEGYRRILMQIVDCVKKHSVVNVFGRLYYPIFSMPGQFEHVKQCLLYLADTIRDAILLQAIKNNFLVLDMVQLLSRVTAKVPGSVDPHSYASSLVQLTHSLYDFDKTTLCEFHADIDITYCARGLCFRTCKMFLDATRILFHVKNNTSNDEISPDKDDEKLTWPTNRAPSVSSQMSFRTQSDAMTELSDGLIAHRVARLGFGRGTPVNRSSE